MAQYEKGRKKTGGRKAGTPNKTMRSFREEVLIAAEAAGNEVGGDGRISYLTWLALKHPRSYVPLLLRSMPQQLEPEQTSPPEEGNEVCTTMEDVCDQLRRFGIPPEQFARAILSGSDEGLPEQEH